MEKPIYGIVYHANHSDSESESEHIHDMYLITWDGRSVHVHQFSGVTSFDVGHSHVYAGTTGPAPSGVPHSHSYYTMTSLNDGHTHLIRGRTGPAIPLPGGGHYHLFQGVTSFNGRGPHTHAYSGKTGNEL